MQRHTLGEKVSLIDMWDWQRIFTRWHQHIGTLPANLVQKLHIQREGHPETILKWWPAVEVHERQLVIQRTLFQERREREFVYWKTLSVGAQHTADWLALCTTSEQIAALLIVASIRRFPSRTNFPNYHNFDVINYLATIAHDNMPSNDYYWHHTSCNVLPHSYGDDTALEDVAWKEQAVPIEQFIDALAQEHRVLFDTWQLVELVFDPIGDHVVVQAAQEDVAAQRLLATERDEQRRIEAQRTAEAQAEYKRQHPRSHQWPPKHEELQKLVWSMPTIEVAALFGVSDVAVGKHCRSYDIPKPPPGFWARVAAGKIPHPNGKPTLG